MKFKLATTCFVIGLVLAPVAAYAADSDTDRSKPATFVKDSVITTKIKTKLAAEHPGSTKHIKVDTDKNGGVWMRARPTARRKWTRPSRLRAIPKASNRSTAILKSIRIVKGSFDSRVRGIDAEVDRASSVTPAASGAKSSGYCAAEGRWLDKNEAQARLVLFCGRPNCKRWRDLRDGLGTAVRWTWVGRGGRVATLGLEPVCKRPRQL